MLYICGVLVSKCRFKHFFLIFFDVFLMFFGHLIAIFGWFENFLTCFFAFFALIFFPNFPTHKVLLLLRVVLRICCYA